MSTIQEKKAQLAQKLAEVKVLEEEIANLILASNIARAAKFAPAITEHEMRTVSDENIKRLMKEKDIDDIAAWTELRCLELEDGASICNSEECSDRDEADEDLVAAARRSKKKRAARRNAVT